MEHKLTAEVDSHSADQEISHLLRCPKIHSHVHKELVSNTCPKINLVHTVISCFLKIRFNIVFLFTSNSPKWSLSVTYTN
jgi:hypothetical protein